MTKLTEDRDPVSFEDLTEGNWVGRIGNWLLLVLFFFALLAICLHNDADATSYAYQGQCFSSSSSLLEAFIASFPIYSAGVSNHFFQLVESSAVVDASTGQITFNAVACDLTISSCTSTATSYNPPACNYVYSLSDLVSGIGFTLVVILGFVAGIIYMRR